MKTFIIVKTQAGFSAFLGNSASGPSIQSETVPSQEQMKAAYESYYGISRELSKLTLKRRLEEMGKWAAFKTVLQTMPSVWDDFVLAQTIRTDDPVFTTHAMSLKLAVGLTTEQFESLLAP